MIYLEEYYYYSPRTIHSLLMHLFPSILLLSYRYPKPPVPTLASDLQAKIANIQVLIHPN